MLSEGVTTVKESFRLEAPLDDELDKIAADMGWNKSEVIRYFLKVGMAVHHPAAKVPAEVVINALPSEAILDRKIEVPVYKIIAAITPVAIDSIRRELEGKKEKEERRDSGD